MSRNGAGCGASPVGRSAASRSSGDTGAAPRPRYALAVTPEQLSAAVRGALTAAVEAGEVDLPGGVPATVSVEPPRHREYGDYATNIALQLAKRAGLPPRTLAELIAARLVKEPGVK